MRKSLLKWFLPGLLAGSLFVLGSGALVTRTSENSFCDSCHFHPNATVRWKRSVHYDTRSGTRTGCADCHLPPPGEGYLVAKARSAVRDVWGSWTKDPESIDWDERSQLEYARRHVYDSSCKGCHENLFPASLSKEGDDAHLYYTNYAHSKDLHCINCHLNAGHHIEGYVPGANVDFGRSARVEGEVWREPTRVEAFASFTERLPGTTVSFRMIAVPGGRYLMGSPPEEPFRSPDEGPVREVQVDSLFMGEVEVTWDEYLAFYAMTSAEGRSTDTEGIRWEIPGVDAVTGATPPYGQPDQGWGMGSRPAITMTFQAVEAYVRWLSLMTGKHYRLPTEAEWEYAARGGTSGPYFFDADPRAIERRGLWGILSRPDTAVINRHVIHAGNSRSRTAEPSAVEENPFGLKNMLGNVAEFVSDWYAEDAYARYPEGLVVNPTGPPAGSERVLRGGSFRDDAARVRVAARAPTTTDACLRTDPQMPKSVWWYSDCKHIGVRVVAQFDAATGRGGKDP